jgi:hypothetical protein
LADIILVSRADMAQMAADRTIEDITDGILGSGLPEAYYMAGWLGSRIYGFSAEPVRADGLLIYNKELLGDIMDELPGDIFDRGEWGFRRFLNYSTEITENLPEGLGLLDLSATDFLCNAVYANGGYVFHPETGRLMKDAPSFVTTAALIKELISIGAFAAPGQDFSEERAVFTHGSPSDAKAFYDMGIDIGVVPYPWGPNIRVNQDSASIDDMFSANYRTSAQNAEMYVITRGVEAPSALAKASVPDYVNLVFSYLGNTELLDTNAWRERTGLAPESPESRMDLTFLSREDRARLEWWRGRQAVFIPQERVETELEEALEQAIAYE